ncbi:hypothetical protein [Novosphingobium mangrovi (ex Huang et al. 2023)]|uniref:Uncharacterized protein n=1 Tax=Novosphingobium mangrovi (ex Huang et al. 2023) TaxID=2976432 RepID=A0ABT2I159_9SPHN|nr:hypothetical protein [Novosphingobium mangrovi (ex Huang et al. 2023)]MCT2398542.1 hypothetical protein [Novosphingobium mangrovi (ex Huang et al. 2023)]
MLEGLALRAILSAIGGRLWKSALGLIDLVKRYPWQCLLIAALCWGGWQYRRADLWHAHADREAAAHRESKIHFAAAHREWFDRVARADAARIAAERQAKETAHDAQVSYDALLADNAGLRHHIALNRLRPGQSGLQRALPTAGTDEDHGPAVPDDATAGPLVATRESDLVVCDELYAYAFGAYGLMLDLRNKDLAIPAPEFGTATR